ncbi:MAG: saccharopine dehydrogenase NADP-binding domain-containing protein [Candidatus Obscuribacterales bacterium]|nr:saccharopine dehydrogenase NADP-binding domain-containing protein [Candidatus Obscuribacterales bacterium]
MIGIIGATGFTGQLVAIELKSKGVDFFIAARNQSKLNQLSEKLGGVPMRLIDVLDQTTYGALDGCTVIINCAGPFTDLGEPIVKEAISRKIHYLDLTGEQSFIKLVYDKYHEHAKKAGIALIPACAFEYAIGDCAGAQLYEAMPDCKNMDVAYHIEGMYTSAGTRKSVIRAMAASAYSYKNGQFTEGLASTASRSSQFKDLNSSLMPFPAGEILMIPRHTQVQNINTYMTVQMPSFLVPLIGLIAKPVLKFAADYFVNAIGTSSPSLEQRQSTTFQIKVVGDNLKSKLEIEISGSDPYLLTSVIIAGAADYLSKNAPANLGAISPAMISETNLIKELLVKSSLQWTENR